MRTWENNLAEDLTAYAGNGNGQGPFGAGLSRLVSAHEVAALRESLRRGELPGDFEAKLAALAEGSLIHRFIERGCRLFVALLRAAQSGGFRQATAEDCEQLLRALAYVRKDDDAIPDYKPGGYLDDQRVVRAVMTELNPLLKAFKAWRLLHEVPALWRGQSRAAA